MHALFLALVLDWNTDLSHLARELPKTHPHAFHTISRDTFEKEIEALKAKSVDMEPYEVVVDIARIVAMVGDGHTRLTFPAEGFFQGHTKTEPPKDPALTFNPLPVRFAIFDDGLTIVRAAEERLVGKRVTRIGAMSAEEAIVAVSPVAHGDNEWQKKEIVASSLAMPEVLEARGVIASREEVPVTLDGGETIVLKPGKLAMPPAQKPWSFRHLPEADAVLFDYDEVANTPEETLAQFAERMFAFIDAQPVSKLIIDLRDNYGGNGSLNRSVLHGIIRSKKLQAPGSLFVLTGRRTFSAAMTLAVALEQHTNAIFIGEPTGGSPNSFGDSRKILLPSSGLTVRVSSLYWQTSDPRDKRKAIEPHVFAAPAVTGDAALAAALDYFGGAPSSTITGNWSGVISVEYQRIPFTIKDGQINSPFKNATFDLRAGTRRLVGTMRANGLEFVVTGVRESAADAARSASERADHRGSQPVADLLPPHHRLADLLPRQGVRQHHLAH